MREANAATPPAFLIASSRGFILPIKHERDSQVNTFVSERYIEIAGMDTIASRLRHARDLRGLSQTDLAKEAEVSQSTVGNIEAGIRGGLPSLPNIAAALGVRHKWLRDGDEPMQFDAPPWPFPGIDPRRFDALDRDQKIEIQGVVRARIEAFESDFKGNVNAA